MEHEHIFENLVQDFVQGKVTRRQLIQNLVTTASAVVAAGTVASAPASAAGVTSAKAQFVHHITWDVKDHMKEVAFYRDVLGMKVFLGKTANVEAHAQCGKTYLTWRGPGARPKLPPPPFTPVVEHIAIAVDPWPGPNMDDMTGNPQLVDELKKAGYKFRTPTGSLYLKDPEGFNVQVCGSNWHTEG